MFRWKEATPRDRRAAGRRHGGDTRKSNPPATTTSPHLRPPSLQVRCRQGESFDEQ
jgi:hypothetical protein